MQDERCSVNRKAMNRDMLMYNRIPPIAARAHFG